MILKLVVLHFALCSAVTYVSIFMLRSTNELHLHPVIVQGLTNKKSCNHYQINLFNLREKCEAIMEVDYGELTGSSIYEIFWLLVNSTDANLENFQRAETVHRIGYKNDSNNTMIPIRIIGLYYNWDATFLDYFK